MITLQNHLLEITLKAAGAELSRIYNKQHQVDYLWSADPEYWGKHAPVLFPIVGALKDDSYTYQEKTYNLARHGFARESTFTIAEQTADTICFELRADENSLRHYPFLFRLRIRYTLLDERLTCEYEVMNEGDEPMWFSIGGHPAFHVPLQEGLLYTDYYLEFSEPETLERWPLQGNLINTHPKEFLKDENMLPLHHDLFAFDAIVLKKVKSESIALKSRASDHGLSMRIDEFPYFGIWAAPHAPFVCLEPWQGIADSVYHNQKLEDKEGMISLPPAGVWSKSWDVRFW